MNPLWKKLADAASTPLNEDQAALLIRYLDLLEEGNAVMNLTRISARPEAEVQHIGDALTLLPHLPPPAEGRAALLADVGSGAGVPGLPLAIVRPDLKVVLIESTRKKADFLKRTASALALKNVTVHPERAEQLGRGQLRDACDVVTARAVGALNVLAEWCLPLLRKDGVLLAMKGARIADELPAAARAINHLGGAVPVIHPADLPGVDHHVIVEIRKLGRTDPRYPRPTQDIVRRPL